MECTDVKSWATFNQRKQQMWANYRNTGIQKTFIPHLSKAGSFLLSHLAFNAYLSILSLASTLIILNPSSTNIMESTLQNKSRTVCSVNTALLTKLKTVMTQKQSENCVLTDVPMVNLFTDYLLVLYSQKIRFHYAP